MIPLWISVRSFLFALFLVAFVGMVGAQDESNPEKLFRSFRQDLGLRTLDVDADLTASSHRRALALFQIGYLSHQDELGRGPGLQMISEGLPPGVYGEVLGAGPDWNSVWQAWLASPTHREVMADPAWRRWGWGVSSGVPTVFVLRFWHP